MQALENLSYRFTLHLVAHVFSSTRIEIHSYRTPIVFGLAIIPAG